VAADSGLRSLNFHSGLLLLEEQIMLKTRVALLRDKVLLALCLANARHRMSTYTDVL
jgi:hypothetical protein